MSTNRLSQNTYIELATAQHNGKYDYSSTIYKNMRSKILIICPEHGEFEQRADAHVNGQGCKLCGYKNFKKSSKSQEQFIKDAIKKHGNKYGYEKVKYTGALDSVIIICPEHGEFEQSAHNHLAGSGCNMCKPPASGGGMYNNYQGWYKLLNPTKFIKPIDEHMKSYKDGEVNYKSRLELKAIKYADFNKFVDKWSLEPFHVKYVKPTDGKIHRYFIDLFLEFKTGDKFLVEIKSKGETKPPRKPSKKTQKALNNYQRALQTYAVNQAKWKAAEQFAAKNKMKFIILTEDELK